MVYKADLLWNIQFLEEELLLNITQTLNLKSRVLFTLLFVLFVFMQTSKAQEVSNVEFAHKVKGCVDSLYADTEKYPHSTQIPLELIIAQAAHESAWGNSRFAIQGNNLFGIRTWNKDDKQIKAKGAPNAPWGLKVYNNWCDSIAHYFHILKTLPVYAEFREELEFQHTISKQSDPINLAMHLAPWSEQGDKYVDLLRKIMAGLYKRNFFNTVVG